MAITRLGAFTPQSSGLVGPVTPGPLTVPSTIPVGSAIIIAGAFPTTKALAAVTDSKSNTWTIRKNTATPTTDVMVLADCLVTTALVSGDTIAVPLVGGGTTGGYSLCGFWQTTCYFESLVLGPTTTAWTGTAAVSPTINTLSAGDLVLGFFDVYSISGSTVPTLTAVGAGYTNETGAGHGFGPDSVALGFDWVSKIGGAPGAETPNGTFNIAGYQTWALSAVYSEAPVVVNPMMAVV